jgi:hypothetical protein
MKGAKCKMSRWSAERRTGPNRPRKGPGLSAHSDRPSPLLWQFGTPFARC